MVTAIPKDPAASIRILRSKLIRSPFANLTSNSLTDARDERKVGLADRDTTGIQAAVAEVAKTR